MWLSIIVLAAIASDSRAPIFGFIDDREDDLALVIAVSGQKPVKEFAAEIETFEKKLLANDMENIEKLLGKPVKKPEKGLAVPIGHPRGYMISGIRSMDEKNNKDHADYYPIGDFAGIEVSYGISGTNPQYAALYFKVDGAFPRLMRLKKDPIPKKSAATRKHTIDEEHWDQMKDGMTIEDLAELFSVSPGDYAAGTDYLTRSWGWQRGNGGTVRKTLEWRSEKGRIVVDFDAMGKFVTAEFYRPGLDPITNITERLKWDRRKFAQLKKYIEERQPFFFATFEPFPDRTWIFIIAFFSWLPFSIVLMRKSGKMRWFVLVVDLLLLLVGIAVTVSEFKFGYSYRQSEDFFRMRPFWYNTYWKRLVMTAVETSIISTGIVIVGALIVRKHSERYARFEPD
jgi:hypothetical protein